MTRFILLAALSATTLLGACSTSTDATSSVKADGVYKGDFQVTYAYIDRSSGSPVTKSKSITGAVGFTIQGDKVITSDVAGNGSATWDPANHTVWVEFRSIFSSNETGCSRWRYYGGLLESDQFLKGLGDISCEIPTSNFISWTTTWKVTRQ
jgi:hypothetical protein